MSLEVHFNGICTHLPASGGHRVVLVRADNGAFINETPVPPHIPMLRIRPDDIAGIDGGMYGLLQTEPGAWRLCGVELSLDGTTDASMVYEINSIPHLATEGVLPMPPVSDEVRGNEEAACYFDTSGGRLVAVETADKAIMSRLYVETGPSPALKVKAFWNHKTTTIRLHDGAKIEIEHYGVEDTDHDFLFHYRVFETVPDKPVVPKPPPQRESGSVSIGCSNSQYP